MEGINGNQKHIPADLNPVLLLCDQLAKPQLCTVQ